MNCDDVRLHLPSYLDDELAVTDCAALAQHLAGCPLCRREEEDAMTLRSTLRASDLYAQAGPLLAVRVRNALRSKARESKPSRSIPWRWAVATAVLVTLAALTILASRYQAAHSREELMAHDVVAGHVRSLETGHLTDVVSSDRHTVKPWFQGKLDFAPPVPDLSDRGWTLAGGRLDYANSRPVAVIVYQRAQHPINVFIWPNENGGNDNIGQRVLQGFNILHWNGTSMTYWVISDLNLADLHEFARALQAH